MRIYSLILIMLLMIPLVIALDLKNCKGRMNENEIPCLLLLPVNQTTTPCNTLVTSFYNNGSTLVYTQTMAIYNSFKCNNTFNQTDFDTYTFKYGTGDTGTIVVEEDENQQYYLYLVVLIILFILVGLGHYLDEGIFTILAGILAMVIGLNLYNNGFPNLVNDFLRNAITAVIWGIGAYLILKPSMKFYEEWK